MCPALTIRNGAALTTTALPARSVVRPIATRSRPASLQVAPAFNRNLATRCPVMRAENQMRESAIAITRRAETPATVAALASVWACAKWVSLAPCVSTAKTVRAPRSARAATALPTKRGPRPCAGRQSVLLPGWCRRCAEHPKPRVAKSAASRIARTECAAKIFAADSRAARASRRASARLRGDASSTREFRLAPVICAPRRL